MTFEQTVETVMKSPISINVGIEVLTIWVNDDLTNGLQEVEGSDMAQYGIIVNKQL